MNSTNVMSISRKILYVFSVCVVSACVTTNRSEQGRDMTADPSQPTSKSTSSRLKTPSKAGRAQAEKAKAAKIETDARIRTFSDNFSIKLLGSNESAQRPITQSNLVFSMEGSCKDIEKNILIERKPDGVATGVLNAKISFILKRTYSPYAIAEEGDPVLQTKTYVLNAQNGYRIVDKVTYRCVPASIRFHPPGGALLAALSGAKNGESGFDTALTRTAFEVEVQDAY